MKSKHKFKKVSLYHLNSVLNVKAVVTTFNQQKALVGPFSVRDFENFIAIRSQLYWTPDNGDTGR